MLLAAGCDDFPRDPENTTENVRSTGTLRVGLIGQEPWAYGAPPTPAGIEVAIVREFAKGLNANPVWTVLSEAQATEKLQNYQLDMVIGGLTKDNPRKKHLGFSRLYLHMGKGDRNVHVMAVAQGENRLLTELEKFLKQHHRQIRQYYENGPPA
jgi:ABC-type amino acid transport substrate-binding protein